MTCVASGARVLSDRRWKTTTRRVAVRTGSAPSPELLLHAPEQGLIAHQAAAVIAMIRRLQQSLRPSVTLP